MLALDQALKGTTRARLAGHAVGLLSYEALALAGAAGDLAWLLGAQVLPALAVLELAYGVLNLPGRKLKRVAVEVYSGTDVQERQALALERYIPGLPLRTALRVSGLWLAAGLILNAFFGLTGRGLLLLLGFGALPAALACAGLCGVVVRKAWSDGALPAPPADAPFGLAPSLRRRYWTALSAPLLAVLAPLAVMSALGLALSPAILGVLAALGLGMAWAWAEDLSRQGADFFGALIGDLGRLSRGDFEASPSGAGPDAMGAALQALKRSAAALELRERSLRVFGPGLDPALGKDYAGALGSPPEARFAAVVVAAWIDADAALGSMDQAAGLASLGRFYESAQDAVRRTGGTVLELGGGQMLAAWGALGRPLREPGERSDAAQAALKAAWVLRSSLPVLASQQRLRHDAGLTWSLAVAAGNLTTGAWGPQAQRRWAWMGGPLAEVRALARRAGGPWVAEGMISGLPAPYAVQSQADGNELVSGPE